MLTPKFSIGDIVFNKVQRRGSYEPSMCGLREKLIVNKVEKFGDTFKYNCSYDGYVFTEDELMSRQEMIDYINS